MAWGGGSPCTLGGAMWQKSVFLGVLGHLRKSMQSVATGHEVFFEKWGFFYALDSWYLV